MIVLICNLRQRKNKRKKARARGISSRVVGGLAAVAITVPAHGFVVSSGGMINATAAAPAAVPSPVAGWMKTFFGACAWAFMIAAGSLVYNHFVGKWQEKGYPILPVAALAATDGMHARGGPAAIPLQSSTAANQPRGQNQRREAQQQAPSQPGWMDQYEG